MRLEIRDLTKEYKRNKIPFTAVNKVNLDIGSGDFISIIGRSGSGKTTFLNIIAGLLKPDSGSVTLDGRSILTLPDREASLLRNTQIGYVPQGQSLLANLTVLENVSLPLYLFKNEVDPEEIAARSLALLEQVGINHLAASYPKQLSGGELRRVSIARSLINKPELLIADEPTSDLDSETTAGIMELFRRIAGEGAAVLLVTHELDTLDYGNRVYSMAGGNLGPVRE
ncbi:ABC transporter ATP-binding protein [Treponema primitia]|uniref:ABC transporter ATP-binding protein n=1 Tax=Treponema primitia TaxID=88058 RepID=UPI00025553CB|nr:ABC transporter ATP-binding protein [Treponema primitia]